MSIEEWWKVTDKGKRNYSEKIPLQHHFIFYKL